MTRTPAPLIEKLSRKLKDPGGVLRLFMSTMVVAVLGRVIQLVLAVVLGRVVGPEGYGLFTLVIGLAMLIQQIAGLGFPALSMRFIPAYRNSGDIALLRGFLKMSESVMATTTLLMSALTFGASYLAGLKPEMAAALALSALVIAPRGFLRLRNRQLSALKSPAKGVAYETLAPNGLTLIFATAGLVIPSLTLTATAAIWVYAVGACLTVVVATWDTYRQFKAVLPPCAGETNTAEWMRIGVPAMLAVSALNMVNRVDVVMLGPLSTLEQVGFYGAAIRLTYILTFPQVILNSVMSPRYAAAYAAGRMGALRRDYRLALGMAAVTTLLPAVLIIFYAGPLIVWVMGEAFRPAANTLAILAVTQVFAAFFNAPQQLMIMTGWQNRLLWINLAGLVVNLVVNALLIPTMGAEGAAWARVAALALIGVGLVASAEAILRNRPPRPKDDHSTDQGEPE